MNRDLYLFLFTLNKDIVNFNNTYIISQIYVLYLGSAAPADFVKIRPETLLSLRRARRSAKRRIYFDVKEV